MKVDQIEQFLTLAETLNYTAAASRLFIAQSVLSRTIQQMEAELGVALFTRSRRGVALTPAGESFAADCRKLASGYHDAVDRAKSTLNGSRGSIRFGCHIYNTDAVTLDIIAGFHKKYPGIALNISAMATSRLLYALDEGEIECAICTGQSARAGIGTIFLRQYRDCLAVAPSHPLASRGEVSVSELKRESFAVMSREMSSRGYNSVLNYCREAGFEPDIAAHAVSVPHLLTILSMGEHVTILSDNYRSFSKDRLVFIPLKGIHMTDIGFQWDTESSNPSLRLLAGYVREEFGREKPGESFPSVM